MSAFAVAAALSACVSSDPVSSTIVGSLTKVSGDSQSVVHNAVLTRPMVVKVQAQDGSPIAGITVRWAKAPADSGKLGDSVSTSDAAGLASMTFTAGSIADSSVQVTASLNASQLSFTHIVTASPATTLRAFSGDGAAGVAGAVIQLAVKVTDIAGNPVSGVTVSWATGPKGGTLVPSNLVTGSTGLSRAALTLNAGPGTYTVTVTGQGLTPVTFTLTQI